MACAIWIVQVNDEAQKRLTVAAGTESGKPAASAAQRAMSPMPSCAGFTQPGRDVLDLVALYVDALAGPGHRSRRAGRRCGCATASRRSGRPGFRTPPRTKASLIERRLWHAPPRCARGPAVRECGAVAFLYQLLPPRPSFAQLTRGRFSTAVPVAAALLESRGARTGEPSQCHALLPRRRSRDDHGVPARMAEEVRLVPGSSASIPT